MRGLFSSLVFICLLLLALNPHVVVEIERALAGRGVLTLDLPEDLMPDGTSDLPRIADIRSVKRGDPWIGETPCGAEIFAAPDHLPGLGSARNGQRLSDPIQTPSGYVFQDAPTHIYTGGSGLTLRLVAPQVKYYDVSGRTFRAAQADLHRRRPLNVEMAEGGGTDISDPSKVTVAHILSPVQFTYRFSRLSREFRSGNYHLVADKTVLTSAHLITLPRWTGYDRAGATDRRRWDDLLCSAAHHELGHLRIQLDILAETLDGYTRLEALTREALRESVNNYRSQTADRITVRQDAYHLYNGGGTRRGMIERPYSDLPFPWLETNDPKTN